MCEHCADRIRKLTSIRQVTEIHPSTISTITDLTNRLGDNLFDEYRPLPTKVESKVRCHHNLTIVRINEVKNSTRIANAKYALAERRPALVRIRLTPTNRKRTCITARAQRFDLLALTRDNQLHFHCPALDVCVVNLLEDRRHIVADVPTRIV